MRACLGVAPRSVGRQGGWLHVDLQNIRNHCVVKGNSQLSAAGGRCAGEKGQGPTGGMSDQATPSPFPHQQIARPQPRNPHKTHCFSRLIWQTNSDTVLRHTIATIAFRPSALAFQHTRAHTKLPTNSRVPSPAALQ
ncbi:ca2+-modulated nonselective cation channel polycystin [Alternaria alternata]|nr:ca2+-modulated nonselective cation channel polycystin [Alternaria alternata]